MLESTDGMDFFGADNEEDRATLAEVAERIELKANRILFQTGEPGGALYIVKSGEVEIYIKDTAGQKIVLKRASDGDFFGEISLSDGRPRTATAVAATDCELFILKRDSLLQVFREKPETALRMIAALGTRLRHADKLLQTTVARNVNEMLDEKISLFQRVADWIAVFSGSLLFLSLNALVFLVWIAFNSLPLGVPIFDAFPYGFLTMIVSLESIFLSCFVLISQNRQTEKDHLRSDVEYEINVKAEMEVAHLHEKTDRIYEQMLEKFAVLETILTKET